MTHPVREVPKISGDSLSFELKHLGFTACMVIIPEFIGFACIGLLIYYGRSRKKHDDRNPL